MFIRQQAALDCKLMEHALLEAKQRGRLPATKEGESKEAWFGKNSFLQSQAYCLKSF
jgi:hypothetical protein